jgi:hypothetical protein
MDMTIQNIPKPSCDQAIALMLLVQCWSFVDVGDIITWSVDGRDKSF